KWTEVVDGWELSGLPAEAFASEHRVPAASLRWWKTELERRARKEEPHGHREESSRSATKCRWQESWRGEGFRQGQGGCPAPWGKRGCAWRGASMRACCAMSCGHLASQDDPDGRSDLSRARAD